MAEAMADVFNSDAFSMISLTQAVQRVPFRPGRIEEMKIFEPRPIATTTAVVEERAGVLGLLPTKHRGDSASLGKAPARTARNFTVPHIPHDDVVLASEVQDIRKFGEGSALEAVADVVNMKLQFMKQNHMTTLEHLRAGALRGDILDSDGSTTLFNLFTEFGVTQTAVDFDSGTAATEQKLKCLEVSRAIETELGGVGYDHIHAFCGKTWFDAFITHATVKDAYSRFLDGQFLRDDNRRGFFFAGIFFEEYRGAVGATNFFSLTEARFFPVGVPGLFINAYAPADFIETANTLGQPIYARQEIMKHNRGIEIHTQSNPLPMCTQPLTLVRGHTTT